MQGFQLVTVADPAGGNPDVHDLQLSGGDFIQIEGVQAAAQEVKTRLLFFKGEFFLDLREGVPYFQEILRKGVDLERVRSIIRQTVQSVPGIVDVPLVDIDLNRSTREATITWTARYQDGTVILSQDFGPLIIDL